jgi:hypothetical protein
VPGEHLVEHHAERPHVGAAVLRALAARLLGAHVHRRADGVARARVALAAEAVLSRAVARRPAVAAQQPGDAEVAEERVPAARAPSRRWRVAREEDVLGLDVAVHHAARVRIGERVGQLDGDAQRVGRGERALAREALPQRLALDERHDVVQRPGCLARVVQRQDVRVLQPREQRDLTVEALVARGRPGHRVEQLERHRPVMLQVVREVHHGRAATRELALDRVPIGDVAGEALLERGDRHDRSLGAGGAASRSPA